MDVRGPTFLIAMFCLCVSFGCGRAEPPSAISDASPATSSNQARNQHFLNQRGRAASQSTRQEGVVITLFGGGGL